ncbi:MAG: GGDEF domain-containing protein [Blautia marasmi]
MDVDNFKLVNDTRGHAYGDIVLMKIAKILTENTPKRTIIARYGGDEFCMFFPGIDRAEQLEPVLIKILENVRKEEFDGMQLSVSVGVSFIQSIIQKKNIP